MYVFKSLNSQDIIISPLEVNKSFETNLYNVNYKPNITGSITGSDFYENISCLSLWYHSHFLYKMVARRVWCLEIFQHYARQLNACHLKKAPHLTDILHPVQKSL